MKAIDILKEELTPSMLYCLEDHSHFKEFVIDAMVRYADLCQSANMSRIKELESLLQLSEAKAKLNYQDAKNLEGKIKEASEKLNEVFLPKNLECDGPYCIGCWKDVVREVLNKLNPNKK